MRTLGEGLSGRANSLNAVRLVLASSVIISHAVPITGGVDPSGHVITELGNWAVHGFFVASGFLIAGSRMRLPFAEFMSRRAFRIVPAYWAALVTVAFVMAPLSTLITGDSWIWRSALGFVPRNAALWPYQSEVANTLTALPLPYVWLGTTWTLAYEFAAYLGAGLLLTIAVVRRRPLLVTTALLLLFVVALPGLNGPPGAAESILDNAVRLGSYFLAGMVFYFAREQVHLRWDLVAVSVAFLVASWFLLGWSHSFWFAQLPFGYLVLAAGCSSRVSLGRVNDISYGVYIYGWPAQQLVQASLPSAGWFWNSVLAILLTLPVAALSWFMIERPAIRFGRAWTLARRGPAPTASVG